MTFVHLSSLSGHLLMMFIKLYFSARCVSFSKLFTNLMQRSFSGSLFVKYWIMVVIWMLTISCSLRTPCLYDPLIFKLSRGTIRVLNLFMRAHSSIDIIAFRTIYISCSRFYTPGSGIETYIMEPKFLRRPASETYVCPSMRGPPKFCLVFN